MSQSRVCGVTAFLLTLICVATAAISPAVAPADFHLKVSGHGDLVMMIPGGWTKTVEQGPLKTLPPTLKLSAANGAMEVLVTPLSSSAGDALFNSPAKLRESAKVAGQQMLGSAKEKSITLHDLKGEKASGYFYVLTDKDPAPGSFEYMTSAFMGVGDLLVTATILHHEKDLPARQQALAMLKGLHQGEASAPDAAAPAPAGAGAAADAGAGLRMKSPDGKWDIVIPGKFTKIGEDTNRTRTSSRLMAADEQDGLTLSVYIEPAAQLGKSTVAREFYWTREQKSPMPKENVRLREVGDKAIVEYLVGKMEGLDLNQQNLYVYMVHGGKWVDVHVSKAGYSEKDKPAFEAIADGVAIEPIGNQ